MARKTGGYPKSGCARMRVMRTQEHNTRREYGRRLIAGTADILAAALVVAVVAIPLHAQRTERPALTITGYVIDA